MKIFYIIFCALLFVYMLWPGPTRISDFKPLPDSAKSTLSGDTVQIPNVSAYFSNLFRNFVVPFYLENYQQLYHFPFPPIELNHPPEYSWVVIKKPTDTTYLEELVYPLRNSLYINGFEIYRSDGTPVFYSVPALEESGRTWFTKVTLRFYTANILVRLVVWVEIIVSILLIYRLGKRIVKE